MLHKFTSLVKRAHKKNDGLSEDQLIILSVSIAVAVIISIIVWRIKGKSEKAIENAENNLPF